MFQKESITSACARCRSTIGLGVAMLLAFTSPLARGQGPCNECGEFVSQQVIVKLQPLQSIRTINTELGTTTIDGMESQGVYLLRVPAQVTASMMQMRLSRDPRVAWAELNYVMVAPNGGTQSFFIFAGLANYTRQYPMQIIEADEVHRVVTGRGQVVAVLDTGLDAEHSVFAGRVAPGGYNYIDGNTDTRDVGNGIDDNNDGRIDEMVGHGTMVSGLIVRVAPGARILPLRVLNCDGVGSSYYVARAINDALDRGATIINASLGSVRPSQTVASAVQAAVDHGALVVAAAGNHDRQEPRYYPAAFPEVLGVAGTDWKDHKAWFSDYGDSIALSAPSTWLAAPVPGNLYAFGEGTSLSAALVTGAAAIVKSANPAMTPEAVESRLRAASQPIDAINPAYSGALGSGRLNVQRAVFFMQVAPIAP